MDRIIAHYLIETPYNLSEAAAVLAGEQSSGTFVAVPGETKELKERFAARVENIEELEKVDRPSIPGDTHKSEFKRAKVSVSWSVENFQDNIPTLISTLQGNLYELRQFTGLKLDDFELPSWYTEKFRGPAFGAKGTKNLAGVKQELPMIGTIIKPSIGMAPEETSKLVRELIEAGIDFIKDDELMASSANSPFKNRVELVMKEINSFQQKSGKKVMYAFNISGDLETLKRNYDTVLENKGTSAMLSINSLGWAGVKAIADKGELSIHGHRNGWGMMNRHPLLGINFPAYAKLWRLAGVDQLHVNGIRNKFWESDESVIRSIKSCSSKFLDHEDLLPVVSSGQWGGQAFDTYKFTNTTDLLYMAGGGIMAHPSGPSGGVKALKQAWEGAVNGSTLVETAKEHKEFRQSVEKFGGK
ncbi:ribulose-bisphosphate carboxylase large subunit family protein [Zunongwangia endophytica]|uniref:Ribulose-bisphosphate carboxylase large subunit family protein n=1 Tax=Zunongwangia endophytica TaxID=1808945 RepID=A0ABV8H6H6_9FLAO|nr:ribulose-bisphosphate carboxylase large subunit family protein [Zunongwangia endophytica]MDN3594841.1 ribulose-bisphosphate carboxylase large subunit family protein [Zunongwangia endophytica]